MAKKNKNFGKINRRHFIRNLSISCAGAVTANGYSSSRVLHNAGTEEAVRMKYRTLGRTGLKVSEVALGGHFTGMGWKEKGSKRQSLRNEVIGEAYKLGMNFFDTNEVSESEKIGIALEANGIERDKILLSADTNAYDGVGKNKSAKEIIGDTIEEVDRHGINVQPAQFEGKLDALIPRFAQPEYSATAYLQSGAAGRLHRC